MDALLEKCSEGLCLSVPASAGTDAILLHHGDTTIVLQCIEEDGRYWYIFSSLRVKRFYKSLLNSVESGYLKTDKNVVAPVYIPVEKTKHGLKVADEFYNDFLITLYVLEHLDEMFPVRGDERILLLRRVRAKVVRGVIHPPTDVKAIRFWEGDELLYEGNVGYDKRIKFKARFVRDLVPGVAVFRGKLVREGRDEYLDVDVRTMIKLVEFREPYGYVDLVEEGEEV